MSQTDFQAWSIDIILYAVGALEVIELHCWAAWHSPGGHPCESLQEHLLLGGWISNFKFPRGEGVSSRSFVGKQGMKIEVMVSRETQVPTTVRIIGIKENLPSA